MAVRQVCRAPPGRAVGGVTRAAGPDD